MVNFLPILYGVSHFTARFLILLGLKIMISHIMFSECLDFRVIRKIRKYINTFFLEFDFKLSVVFLFVFSI